MMEMVGAVAGFVTSTPVEVVRAVDFETGVSFWAALPLREFEERGRVDGRAFGSTKNAASTCVLHVSIGKGVRV